MGISKKTRRLIGRALLGVVGLLAAFLVVVTVDSWRPSGHAPSGKELEVVKRSERYKTDHFENWLPRTEPEFFPMLARWLKGAPNTVPTEPVPFIELHGTAFAAPSPVGLRITWLGHSTSLIEMHGDTFLIDPVWGERCSPLSFIGPTRFHPPPLALDQLPTVNAVVISHDHYDHLDYPTIVALKDKVQRFIVPLGVGSHLRYWGVADDRIIELDWWQSVRVGSTEVTATPARHFSGRSLVMSDKDATLWSSWAFTGPTHRVYYSGDTAMFPEFADIGKKLGPFDATLMEVAAYNQMWADVHLGPEQAMDAHVMLKGKLLIPVHWGTFDLALHSWTEPMERLLVGAQARGIALATPRPGESIEPGRARAAARWWPEVPWQSVEEAPVRSSGL